MSEDKNNNEGSINLEQDKLELREFKKDLLNLVRISADVSGDFCEGKFFDDMSELLCEAGVYDDIQKDAYISSRKGIRIDGWNWNKTERMLSAVITKFSNDEDLVTISKSDIEKLPFSKHLIDARNLISNIDLKSMVKNKIAYQNSSEVMNLVIKNSRLANFLFNIQELQIHQILTNSILI